MPGVAVVLTGQNLAADDLGPLPCAATAVPMTTPLVVPPCYALARDIVRYVGEPVAFVVAESEGAARDAAEAVTVDYASLPPVVSIADAVLPGAPAVWPEARGNIAFQFNRGDTARWRLRSATPPMSSNANSSITASSPRRWRHAARLASLMR